MMVGLFWLVLGLFLLVVSDGEFILAGGGW